MKNRILSVILGAVALLALASVATPRKAEAGCTAWDPLHEFCLFGTPNPPAGAHYCVAGEPTADQMSFYSGTNFTGYCVTLTRSPTGAAGSNEPNANADYWYLGYSIGSLKVGANTTGYIYQGTSPNFGYGWQVSPGYAGDISSLGIHSLMAR